MFRFVSRIIYIGLVYEYFFKYLFIYFLIYLLFAQDHHYNNATYCNPINIILSRKSQKPFEAYLGDPLLIPDKTSLSVNIDAQHYFVSQKMGFLVLFILQCVSIEGDR